MNLMKKVDGCARRRMGLAADLPSIVFLLGVVTNTTLIACSAQLWVRILLATLQAMLLAGCQEAKHQSVHGSFLTNRRANDIVGTLCASLFGVNFITYRYFHLKHHRAICTDSDPEGELYALSWRTRWIWLLAPLELPWVAYHINRIAWSMVPAAQVKARRNALACMLGCGLLLAYCAWQAPQTILWAYAIPLALHAWFDFLLTQAEHYGIAVSSSSFRRDPGAVTHDILLPFGLGWLNLHRSLHRVHHQHPGVRWHQAPARLRADPTASPVPLNRFVRRWLAEGPRLWQLRTSTTDEVRTSGRSQACTRT
jgi:fatty acid desaturase